MLFKFNSQLMFPPHPFPCYHFDLSEPHLLRWQSRWGALGLCTKHQPSWLCGWQHLLHGRPPTQIYNPWYLPEWQPLLSALGRKHENMKLKNKKNPEKHPNFPENSTRMLQIHWWTASSFTKELQKQHSFPSPPWFHNSSVISRCDMHLSESSRQVQFYPKC